MKRFDLFMRYFVGTVASVLLCAGTLYPGSTGNTRVQTTNSKWGVCLDPGPDVAVRPYNPFTDPRGDFSNGGVAYAGFWARVTPGASCHRAADVRGDAVFGFNVAWTARGHDRFNADTLRSAIVNVDSFKSRAPAGVRSGSGSCESGTVCPRTNSRSSCRFRLYAVDVPERTSFRVGAPTRTATWTGPVEALAIEVRSGGRGFMLISETDMINGGSWDVTELLRSGLRRRTSDGTKFVLSIASDEPSLLPLHRMKDIDCDGFFTARMRIDYTD